MRWIVVAALMLAPVAHAGYSTPMVEDDPGPVWQCHIDGIMVFQRGACPPGATVKGWNVPDVKGTADAEGQRAGGRTPSGSPEADRSRGLPQGDELSYEIVQINLRLDAIYSLAEDCEVAMNDLVNTSSCLRMMAAYQDALPHIRRLRELQPATAGDETAARLMAAGLRSLGKANRVYNKLNRDFFGRE